MRSPVNFWKHYLKPFVRARNRKPIGTIMREVAGLFRAHGTIPEHYFRLGLYADYITSDVHDYLLRRPIYRFQERVNGEKWPEATNNKVIFSALMAKHGIRCVTEYFSYDPEQGFARPGGEPISAATAARIIAADGGRAFVKPVRGSLGIGIRIYDQERDDLQRFCKGSEYLIFQPFIEQHPVLAQLNPSSVNTVRIDTLRENDRVTCNLAALRFGRAGQVTDNGSAGGMAAPVDIATGAVGTYARTKAAYSTERLDRHPDSGIVFSSITVPFWPELLDLVQRGAAALDPLVTLGWDIAITPDGPMVIEANARWGSEVFQLCYPLRHTEIGRRALQ